MLCQLSYRGSLGRKSLAKLAFDLLQRVADAGEDSLELDRPGQVLTRQVGELAPDEPLLEAQDELAGHVLVETLVGNGCVQLGAEPDQLLVGLAFAGQVGAQPLMDGVVEVAVVEALEIALGQVGTAGADGEEVALEPVAGPDQLSPCLPDRPRASRGNPQGNLEPVGRVPGRLVLLRPRGRLAEDRPGRARILPASTEPARSRA